MLATTRTPTGTVLKVTILENRTLPCFRHWRLETSFKEFTLLKHVDNRLRFFLMDQKGKVHGSFIIADRQLQSQAEALMKNDSVKDTMAVIDQAISKRAYDIGEVIDGTMKARLESAYAKIVGAASDFKKNTDGQDKKP
jgi:hypothetical protein